MRSTVHAAFTERSAKAALTVAVLVHVGSIVRVVVEIAVWVPSAVLVLRMRLLMHWLRLGACLMGTTNSRIGRGVSALLSFCVTTWSLKKSFPVRTLRLKISWEMRNLWRLRQSPY